MAKAAVIQLVSQDVIEHNLTRVNYLLSQMSQDDVVSLVVLPENVAFMGANDQDKLKFAETFGAGPIQESLATMAKKYHCWIVAGTIPIRGGSPHHIRAASLVFDDNGECVARYDKIHLFNVRVSEEERHEESATIEPGHEVVVVDTPVGRLGLSVCYDLRFPELYRQLVKKGAELFAIPAAFTATTGLAHWEVLLRARAIENLCYVLAPNQAGIHPRGRHTYGNSMIIEPWGNILGRLDQGEGFLTADIDLHRLQDQRRHFPCNDHHLLGHL